MPRLTGCRWVHVVAASLAAFLAACSGNDAAIAETAQQLLIDNVTILDGSGGAAMPNAGLLVKDGQIVEILAADAPRPPAAQRIDGQQGFLLPGFIDMHSHLLFPRCPVEDGSFSFDERLSKRALSQQLDYGITTIRSPASPTLQGLALRDALARGEVRGPRAFASAELINGRDLTHDQMEAIVAEAMLAKPDYLKAYAALGPDQVRDLAAIAHEHDLPLIGHLQRTSWEEGVRLGVDHLVHAVDWSIDSLPAEKRDAYRAAAAGRRGFLSRLDWLEAFDPDAAQHQPLIDALVEKQVSVDLTLIALDAKFLPADAPRYRANPVLENFPELVADWNGCGNVSANWTPEDFEQWQRLRGKLFRWVERLNDAGVLLVSGTDLTNPWIAPGEGLHQEFELLAEAGLSTGDILRMTGANAAAALDSADIGMIEPGRRADLVLLSADPKADIRATRSIQWVMQGGTMVFTKGEKQ